MQRQTNDDDKQEPVVEFEQCPVCESYKVSENNNQYCCSRCGLVWIAVRRWE